MKQEKLTFNDLAEMFVKKYPYIIPNRRNVGTFAKQAGYIKIQQMINNKTYYFYIREEDIK